MTIAVAGNRSSVGVAVAEVNLKFIWEVISGIKVGRTGDAFVLDRPGRLVAHPDISLVLRADEAAQRPLQALRAAILARPGEAATGRDIAGEDGAGGDGADPRRRLERHRQAAARRGLRADLRGAVAHRGAARRRRGAGGGARLVADPAHDRTHPPAGGRRHADRRGTVRPPHRASRPATSSSGWRPASTRWRPSCRSRRSARERISRLKRFLAPQVAELVDRTGDDRVLDGRRVEVVVVFCDLRGFTAFSARAEPETIIGVLREYYDALERVVSAHEATLISFSGDGAMVLLNAPVSCSGSGVARRRHGARHADERAGAPGRLARAGRPARLRRRPGHGARDGRADRLRRPPRLHRRSATS